MLYIYIRIHILPNCNKYSNCTYLWIKRCIKDKTPNEENKVPKNTTTANHHSIVIAYSTHTN